MKKKDKFSVNLAKQLADNLNRNVCLEHVKEVERGAKPADDNYYFIKKNLKHFRSFSAYKKWKH